MEPQESGVARSQNCACRSANAYAVWIVLQSIAPAGDTETQLANPSAATTTPMSSVMVSLRGIPYSQAPSESWK